MPLLVSSLTAFFVMLLVVGEEHPMALKWGNVLLAEVMIQTTVIKHNFFYRNFLIFKPRYICRVFIFLTLISAGHLKSLMKSRTNDLRSYKLFLVKVKEGNF